MNVDNIRKTIESLKASTTYDQTDFTNPCGTPACIAGHAAVNAGYTLRTNSYTVTNENGCIEWIDNIASKWFGLKDNSDESYQMFRCDPLGKDEEQRALFTTKEHAIAMLENFIKTGEINWNAINER